MMSLQIKRRQLLKALAIATATMSVSNRPWAQVKFESNPFILGVASGSPTANSIVLWSRLIDSGIFGSRLQNEPIEVKWEIAEDAEFKKIIKVGISMALPELAHSVHAEIDQLPANKWFYYRFLCGGSVSPVGKTRTLPAANEFVKNLKFAYASCQNYEHGYYTAYKYMAKENLDLVMFLGDYIYEYGRGRNGVRAHDSGTLISLDDYRKRYALYKKDKYLQDMHAACPWLMTWDDHEVQNDYAGLNPGTFGPYVSDFFKRRASAYQAYYEHMPIRSSALIDGIDGLLKGAELRLYGNFRYGKLANIRILDDRQYRDPEVCSPAGIGSSVFDPATCPDLGNTARTILGVEQERWLSKNLGDAKENIWNVFGQPTLFGQRYFPGGVKIWNDGWDGFPAARNRLIQQLVENKLENLVVFGGDLHENWVGYIKTDYDKPDSPIIGVEFCGTSITSRSEGANDVAQRLARNPHFVFTEGSMKGYGVAEFTTNALTVTLRVLDDVLKEDAVIQSLAQFKVDVGSNKIQRNY